MALSDECGNKLTVEKYLLDLASSGGLHMADARGSKRLHEIVRRFEKMTIAIGYVTDNPRFRWVQNGHSIPTITERALMDALLAIYQPFE